MRFDLEKVGFQTAVTKFNDSESDGEAEDSDPGEGSSGVASGIAAKRAAAVFSLQQVLNRQGGPAFESTGFVRKVEIEAKPNKIVGRRFVVENVSEEEHWEQQDSKSIDIDDEYIYTGKFENIKNIDLLSKSDSEKTTPRSSVDSRSFIEELKKNKEIMMENMRKSEERAKRNGDNERRPHSAWTKVLQNTELSAEGMKSVSRESSTFSVEVAKNGLLKEHEQELRSFKHSLDIKLDEMKKDLEEEFAVQKLSLESSMRERLSDLKREMVEKEEEEVQKLVAEMDESRAENLKKARSELEICYEKERQDIMANLKAELDKRKRELLELRSHEISKLESDHGRELDDEKQAKMSEMEITKQRNEKVEGLKKELEREFDNIRTELRTQQREKITKITEDHEKCLADILRDFRIDVSIHTFMLLYSIQLKT